MYIGAPAWPAAGPVTYASGIKSAKGIVNVVNSTKGTVSDFGGFMFW